MIRLLDCHLKYSIFREKSESEVQEGVNNRCYSPIYWIELLFQKKVPQPRYLEVLVYAAVASLMPLPARTCLRTFIR